jgi:hypothetical protein
MKNSMWVELLLVGIKPFDVSSVNFRIQIPSFCVCVFILSNYLHDDD